MKLAQTWTYPKNWLKPFVPRREIRKPWKGGKEGPESWRVQGANEASHILQIAALCLQTNVVAAQRPMTLGADARMPRAVLAMAKRLLFTEDEAEDAAHYAMRVIAHLEPKGVNSAAFLLAERENRET